MIINKVIMENWQPYEGKISTDNATIFDISEINNKKSTIIYGENGFGKSSFFEAIYWAMYGRVKINRNTQKTKKILQIDQDAEDEDSKKILMNNGAIKNNDFNLSVEIEFNHGGDDYKLTRRLEPRTGIKDIQRDSQLLPTLNLYNITENKLEGEPQEFINSILPEKLSRFFMVDGEELEHYRDLMEKQNTAELVLAIESILRLECLTEGISQCEDGKKKLTRKIMNMKKKLLTDGKKAKDIQEMQDTIDEWNKDMITIHATKKKAQEDYTKHKNWLDKEPTLREAQKDISDAQKAIDQIQNQDLPKLMKQRAECFKDSWKIFVSGNANALIEETQQILSRQEGQQEKINELQRTINIAEEAIKGEKCSHCNSQLKSLTPGEIDIHLDKINEAEKEKIRLIGKSETPDPSFLWKRLNQLKELRTDKDLSKVKIYSGQIRKLQNDLRDERKKKEAAMKLTSADSRREVKERTRLRNEALTTSDACNTQIDELEYMIEKIEAQIKTMIGSGLPKVEKSAEFRKSEIKENLLIHLGNFLEKRLEPYREEMRNQVEKYASEVFMRCTNKPLEYDGIMIGKDFKIAIKTKDGDTTWGGDGKGQWSLVAYSLLDALTKCSEIEFPFIIDTPGRSLGKDNLNRVFDHLFFKMNRQVILLPNERELDPNYGNDNYGAYTAKTYIVERDFVNKSSSLVEMTKEGVKVE